MDKLELLRRVPLLAGLRKNDLEEVSRLADEVDVPAGKVLTREGSSGDAFYMIIDGRVRVERGGAPLRTLGPGEFLGEIALVDDGPRTATAICDSDTHLFVIGHREFHSLLDRFPAIQLAVLQALAERVRRLEPDSAT